MPESTPTSSQLLCDAQLAEILGLHRVTVRKLALLGKIPSYKFGRARRFNVEEVLAAQATGGSR
jgi:excisionase family DNA binding protein